MKLEQMQEKIFQHYSLNHQIEKGIEECEELIVEYKRYLAGESNFTEMLNEIADVGNIKDQTINHFNHRDYVEAVKVAKCERELKRIEDKEMKSALEMSERDIENAIDGEWKNGDECVIIVDSGYNIENGWDKYLGKKGIVMSTFKSSKNSCAVDMAVVSHNGTCVCWRLDILSKPITPEQKQAQIDEKNGELLFSIWIKITKGGLFNCWDTFNYKGDWIELGKQVDFTGKLSA